MEGDSPFETAPRWWAVREWRGVAPGRVRRALVGVPAGNRASRPWVQKAAASPPTPRRAYPSRVRPTGSNSPVQHASAALGCYRAHCSCLPGRSRRHAAAAREVRRRHEASVSPKYGSVGCPTYAAMKGESRWRLGAAASLASVTPAVPGGTMIPLARWGCVAKSFPSVMPPTRGDDQTRLAARLRTVTSRHSVGRTVNRG